MRQQFTGINECRVTARLLADNANLFQTIDQILYLRDTISQPVQIHAVIQTYRQTLHRTAFQAARLGDAAAKRVLGAYLQGLSIGIINLNNALQPEIICLGGGVSNAEDDLLLDPLRELVRQGSFDKNTSIRLEKASLGNDAGVVGAALLCNMI